MDEETGKPEDLRVELRRLRLAFRRLLTIEPSEENFEARFASAKNTIRLALERVDVIRKEPKNRHENAIARAREVNRAAARKRHERILAEVEAIESEIGRKLGPYILADKMNQRGNVAPHMGAEWNATSVRYALKALGRM